jgi:hypothetical protein
VACRRQVNVNRTNYLHRFGGVFRDSIPMGAIKLRDLEHFPTNAPAW